MRRPWRVLGVGAWILCLALAACADERHLPIEPLTIVTAQGSHTFNVEIAKTSEEQSRGLMFRESLAPDAGMLFVHDRPRQLTMWMKNTVIPLDMVFIDRNGSIIRIEEMTKPYSLQTISSGKPATAVLEIAGGRSGALGISAGDRVVHNSFPPLPATPTAAATEPAAP